MYKFNPSILFYTAGMWFGVMFAILVELVPKNVRATAVTVTLFIINNIGGNIPVAIDPLKNAIGFRRALAIMYSGSLFLCKLRIPRSRITEQCVRDDFMQ